MSANTTGAGRKIFSFVIILFVTALAGFLVYEYTPMFKTSGPGDKMLSSAHKIDKQALIANLEEKIQSLPAEDVAANLDGYKRLVKLAPGNIRYKQKADYYRARSKEVSAGGVKAGSGLREFIKIGFPAPRVLDRPDTGQMLGRVETGKVVEILDSTVVAAGSLITTWYQIRFGSGSGWISKLGTSGDIMEKPVTAEKATAAEKPVPADSAWKTLAATMIDDYGGKIISIDRLDIMESHFSLYSGMSPEQARQTCENIGYYIRNSTGESPVVVAFVNSIPVAKADPIGIKYQAKLIAK